MPFGGLAVDPVPMRGNLAEEAEGIGFVAALTAGTGVGKTLFGADPRLVDSIDEQVDLTETNEQTRLHHVDLHGLVGVHRVA